MNSNRSTVGLVTRIGISAALALGLAAALAVPGANPAHADGGNRSDLKNFQHVFIIMMENTGYTSLIRNSNAPWLNFAAQTSGLPTSYFGVTHPSHPHSIPPTSPPPNVTAPQTNPTLDHPNLSH